MNQQEYLDVADRVRVSNALQILTGIMPEHSSVITVSELQHILTALRYWEEKLLKQIAVICNGMCLGIGAGMFRKWVTRSELSGEKLEL